MTALPEPEFRYMPFLAEDYDDLLNQHRAATPALMHADLKKLALTHGRVLLQARAGAGKTTTLARVLSDAQVEGMGAYWADLATLRLPPGAEANEVVDLLFAHANVTPGELRADRSALLVVDGLNEAPGSVADVLLEAVDLASARHPNVGIVVADRLTRRSAASEERWVLCGLTPATSQDIRDRLGRDPEARETSLLEVPFYLSKMGTPNSASRRADILGQMLAAVIPDAASRRQLARAAFEGYATEQRLILMRARVVEAIGAENVERMLSAGLLRDEGEARLRFSHQLLHDYLAANAVLGVESWTDRVFDILTLNAASPDPLVLLAEQVPVDELDTLVRRVYDWNLYVAAYLLAEGRAAGRGAVAPATEAALLALLAERRFDPFLVTARRAADGLRLVPTQLALSYLEATKVEVVHTTAQMQLPEDRWYRSWVELFVTDEVAKARDALTDPDGVRGWTAANALRRLVTPEDGKWLIEMATNASRVVRWRVVHVLGVFDGLGLDELFSCMTDEQPAASNVRYGALRSIVEQASRKPDVAARRAVMERLALHAKALRNAPHLAKEIERTLLLTSPPVRWLESCAPLLEELLAQSLDEEEHLRWMRLVRSVRRRDIAA